MQNESNPIHLPPKLLGKFKQINKTNTKEDSPEEIGSEINQSFFPFPLITILPSQAPYIEKRILQKNDTEMREITRLAERSND